MRLKLNLPLDRTEITQITGAVTLSVELHAEQARAAGAYRLFWLFKQLFSLYSLYY